MHVQRISLLLNNALQSYTQEHQATRKNARRQEKCLLNQLYNKLKNPTQAGGEQHAYIIHIQLVVFRKSWTPLWTHEIVTRRPLHLTKETHETVGIVRRRI